MLAEALKAIGGAFDLTGGNAPFFFFGSLQFVALGAATKAGGDLYAIIRRLLA